MTDFKPDVPGLKKLRDRISTDATVSTDLLDTLIASIDEDGKIKDTDVKAALLVAIVQLEYEIKGIRTPYRQDD